VLGVFGGVWRILVFNTPYEHLIVCVRVSVVGSAKFLE
jgi:hypothetical protein